MNRRSFFLSGLALTAFPLAAAAESTRYNFQGRTWGGPKPQVTQAWGGVPQQSAPLGWGDDRNMGKGNRHGTRVRRRITAARSL
jgi:hypothetical protein